MNGELLTINKVLNNNVVITVDSVGNETVIIHKGIGFGKKQGAQIPVDNVEKVFILKDQKEQEQYKKLVPHLEENFIALMNDIIHHIQASVDGKLNEHIHIALTDHIAFVITRVQQGLTLKNPFLQETKTLYPKEYEIAKDVVAMINEHSNISLPEEEVGFIALHIHSSISYKSISEINQHSQLIHQLIFLIEKGLNVEIDREGLNYMRLVRHLRFTIERVKKGEIVEEPIKLKKVLQEEYPLCYNISWKVIKVMQQFLKQPVFEAEAVYLTIHLQRLSTKSE
ncbi:PtsGHI operon antiterminator [Anaerobacillus alkalilacustris]|uniref:PtsGHI operon antiterminator n=1 Tax=Anaerobacillus alkalilacustris TaxID=393763 RepID=A0A1S2LLM4_9BACI|nr:PRD domain-containing protein [Anaerobacillus alkalilacustris]OIJ13419.1 PtsGHI operon antiterminator [Anaerobacillus alkalilacustris]